MPRIATKIPRPAPAAAAAAAAAPARARAKKPATQQDRLKARTLFFRRLKRSLRPGLWVIGGIVAVVIMSQAMRAVPDIGPVITPVGGVRHAVAGIAAAAGFRVTNIQIIGAETTPLPLIEAALGVAKGDPVLGFSMQDAVLRINQLGPVQSATIRRAWPGTIIITVTERAPYAIWQTQAPGGGIKFVLIDKAGNVIANQDAAAARRRNPALLLLAGADAPQNASTLMGELEAEPDVLSRVVAAQRIGGLRWNLILKDQAVVRLPEDGEQQAIALLAALQESMALLDRPVEFIDLRLPGKMIVRPGPPGPPPPAPGHI
jgi:cell division protein FtsQ